MILKTRQVGDAVLRMKSRVVPKSRITSDKIQALIDSMIETLRDNPGVGLAASQVGENLQIIIVEDLTKYQKIRPKKLLTEQDRKPVKLTVIINPKLTIIGAETATYFEGCLSVSGYVALVERALHVKVTGLNRSGKPVEIEATGWFARILQHELDHLSGELYIDKMISRSFITEKAFSREWADKQASELAHFTKTG